MDRSYMINDYISDNENSLQERNQALEYLNGLKFRISDTKTLTELMVEVSTFLEKYNVSDEIKDGITRICNEFDENTDALTARSRLEDYLANYLIDKENEYQKSNQVVHDIKTDVINDSKEKLESVGINLTGDVNESIENINDYDDVNRIKNNVDKTYDYFYDRNKDLDVNNNIDVSMSNIDEIVESSKDDIFLEDALENEESKLETENPSLFQTNSDGTVQVNGNYSNNDSMNFAIMMTTSLLVFNNYKIDTNLDMKFIKNKNDINNFKIIYGNFPLANHPENKLDESMISRISKLAQSYKSNIDYMDILGQSSPEIKEAMGIIYNHVLNRKGAFQMAINNHENNHDMAFGMDQNYHDILDAFNSNGAYVSYDSNENGIVTVNETIPGNQLLILNSTNESLDVNLDNNINPELINSRQYVKKLDSNEAAKANYTVLIILCIIEIILLGVYFTFLFNK